MQSALELIDINKPNNLVYIGKSKIKDELSKGLFAKQDIKKGTRICIYFGDILEEDELPELYQKNKNIMKFIRKGNDFLVDGSKAYLIDNLNLSGVYVNDYKKLNSIKKKDMRIYFKTRSKCNVKEEQTTDFPIYVARKDIKKGEELTVHYSIGYWLLEMGITPQELLKYKKTINNFYNN
jgi:SET domain-containing protein